MTSTSEAAMTSSLCSSNEQLEKTDCSCCERRAARLCYQCYAARTPRAQKVVAVALAASEARREERHRKDHEKDVVERARERGAGARDDLRMRSSNFRALGHEGCPYTSIFVTALIGYRRPG